MLALHQQLLVDFNGDALINGCFDDVDGERAFSTVILSSKRILLNCCWRDGNAHGWCGRVRVVEDDDQAFGVEDVFDAEQPGIKVGVAGEELGDVQNGVGGNAFV